VDSGDDDPEIERLLAALTAPRRSNEARAHHTISDFYLKRFADDEHWLTLVDLHAPKPQGARRKTNNVSVNNDFYTVIGSGGEESPAVERLLSHVEGAAARAMKTVANAWFFPPPPRDRLDLSLWMAFQMVRTPEARRRHQAIADVAAKVIFRGIDTPEKARARLRAVDRQEPTEKDVADLLRLTSNLGGYDIVPDPNEHIEVMLSTAEQLAPLLAGMSWSVAKFKEPALLSSDHPLTYYVEPENRDPMRGVGLMTADEIRFPLDPSTVLLMSPGLVPQTVGSLAIEAAREINQLTVDFAFEFVFMHPDQDHLAGLDLGAHPRPLLEVDGAIDGTSTDGVNRAPERLRPARRRRSK
jgi:hypothetical protein